MRKLILWDLISVDGYFDGAHPWDIGWHGCAWSEEMGDFVLKQLRSADLLLFGRVTYQGMAQHWPGERGDVADLMNTIEKVVFSKSLTEATWNNAHLSRRDPAAHVSELKAAAGTNILVFGSAHLAAPLVSAGLVDEIRVAVAPVVLGEGRSLFKSVAGPVRLELLEATRHASGAVVQRYAPIADGPQPTPRPVA